MKNHTPGLLLGFVLATGAFFSTPPATAQQFPPAIAAVINMQVLLEESSAAKSIRGQVEKLRTEFQDEVNRQDQQLREQEQELKRQQSVLSPEAFNAKRRDFQQQVTQAQQEVQTRLRNLDEMAAQGLNGVRRALLPILVDLQKEVGYNMVLGNTQIIFAAKQLDITEEVLRRLNSSLPTVNLLAPAKGGPAAATPAKAGGTAQQPAPTRAGTPPAKTSTTAPAPAAAPAQKKAN